MKHAMLIGAGIVAGLAITNTMQSPHFRWTAKPFSSREVRVASGCCLLRSSGDVAPAWQSRHAIQRNWSRPLTNCAQAEAKCLPWKRIMQ